MTNKQHLFLITVCLFLALGLFVWSSHQKEIDSAKMVIWREKLENHLTIIERCGVTWFWKEDLMTYKRATSTLRFEGAVPDNSVKEWSVCNEIDKTQY